MIAFDNPSAIQKFQTDSKVLEQNKPEFLGNFLQHIIQMLVIAWSKTKENKWLLVYCWRDHCLFQQGDYFPLHIYGYHLLHSNLHANSGIKICSNRSDSKFVTRRSGVLYLVTVSPYLSCVIHPTPSKPKRSNTNFRINIP
jgi:hypothetical protein